MTPGRIATCLAAPLAGLLLGYATLDGSERRNRGQTEPPPPTKSTHRSASPEPQHPRLDRDAELARITSLRPAIARLRALVDLSGRIPEPELGDWLRATAPVFGAPLHERVFHRLLQERLQQAAPEETMRILLGQRGRAKNEHMATWARDDPDAAEAFLRTPLPPGTRKLLANVALKEWASSDPDRALRLLDALSSKVEARQAWEMLREIGPLIDSHRDELASAAKQWPAGWRRAVFTSIANHGWRTDLGASLKWLTGVEGSPLVFAKVVADQADHNNALFENLHLLPDGWLKVAVKSSGYALVRHNALAWMEADATKLGIDPQVLALVQEDAAEQIKSPADIERLFPNAAPKVQAQLAVRMVNSTFYTDPEGAGAWIAALEIPDARQAAQQRYDQLRGYQENRATSGGLGGGSLLPRDHDPQSAFLSTMADWNQEQASAAIERYRDLPPEDRSQRMQIIAKGSRDRVIPPTIVGEALQYLLSTPTDHQDAPADLSRDIIRHAAYWSQVNTPAAAQWAAGLPDCEARQWALRNVARHWAGQSPSEARTWADSLPQPADRELTQQEIQAVR